MANYDASIRVSTKVDTSQMQKLQIQIDKATDKVADLSAKYDELKNKKIPTAEYQEIAEQVQKAEAQFDKLLAKQDEMIATGRNSGVAWDSLQYKMEEIGNTIKYAKGEMQDLVDTGKAFALGGNRDEIADAGHKLALAQAELRALNTRQEELYAKQVKNEAGVKRITDKFKGFGKAGESALGKINTKAKKTGGLMSTLASRFKGIALSLLIFQWITKGFNAMVSAVKAGFSNLVKYSDSYNKSMSEFKSANTQLKNSFATAFAPIVQVAIPHLVTLINFLTGAINKVAQFTAALTGKSTWIKATSVQEDYAAALNGTASAAKRAAGALAGFDDLDVLSQNTSSGSGISAEDMFEEVEVDNGIASIAEEWAESIKAGDWFAVGATIAQNINNALSAIDWQGIKNSAAALGEDFALFLNGGILTADWKLVGATLSNAINTAFISLYAFVTTFDWNALGQAVVDSINGFFETVDWTMIGETISTGIIGLLETARMALQETDWTEIGEDIATLLKNIDWATLLKDVGGLMVDAIVAGFELLDAFVDKIVGNEAAFEVIAILIGTITTALVAYSIQQALATAGLSLWEGISVVATTATSALGTAFGFLTNPITLIILAIGAIIAIVVLLVKNWDTVKEVALNVWNKIKEVWCGFAEWFDTTVWEPFKIAIKAFANFFIGIWNGIVGAFESAINWVIDGINSAINAINSLISAGTDLLSFVGININFQIPTIKPVSFGRIPELANGAVLRGGNPFLAILGDQPYGQTNIETPAGLIKEMVVEGIAESGGVGAQKIAIQFTGNLAQLGKVLKPVIDTENARIGKDFRKR